MLVVLSCGCAVIFSDEAAMVCLLITMVFLLINSSLLGGMVSSSLESEATYIIILEKLRSRQLLW